MMDVSERFDGAPVIAVQEVHGEAISRFRVIAGSEIEKDIFRIEDMVEKPSREEAPSNLAIIGRYILTPDIFSASRTDRAGSRRRDTDHRRASQARTDAPVLRLPLPRASGTTPATSLASRSHR
jgi:UTP-glucose-1-phosphate uridylyltransferase